MADRNDYYDFTSSEEAIIDGRENVFLIFTLCKKEKEGMVSVSRSSAASDLKWIGGV